ncbi:hypothetical protein V6N13_046758 [Hibiscus sabdariffa]
MHSHDYVGARGCEVNRSIGEAELLGGPPKKLVDNSKISQPDKINKLSGGNIDFPFDSPKKFGPGRVKVVEEVTGVGEVMTTDPRRAIILDDLNCMGFNKKDLDPSNDVAVESDVEMVHETVLAGNFGSWAKDIQDKVLNEAERKKRDRTIKKLKKKEKFSEKPELEGRSLSDPDLKARWDFCTNEAKRALKVGKDLGIQIRGDENEVVDELTRLEELDIANRAT